MNKMTILLPIAVTLICASQWASNAWLANNIHAQTQLLITKIPQETRNNKTATSTLPAANPHTLSKELEILISKQVSDALTRYSKDLLAKNLVASNKTETTKSTTKDQPIIATSENNNSQREDSQEAYWAAMDIVSSATVNSSWDESINDQLYSYRDQLNDAQRNEIVIEYIQAFNDGLIGPGITPPF
jgi:hypothetical protein